MRITRRTALFSALTPLFAETGQQRERRLAWYREARFGMFIHWGLYAIPAGEWKGKPSRGLGEWIMLRSQIPVQEYEQLADLVHSLQPNCLVSGRVGNGLGDYDSTGDNQISVGKVTREWETPVTMNDTWGFRKDDHNWKPASVMVRQLAMTASRGGNYLLTVGPTAEGVIPQPSAERLREMGRWMKVNGESIYGTSPSPFPYELPWGVTTSKPGKLYFNIFRKPAGEFELYGLKTGVAKAYSLEGRKALAVKQSGNSLKIGMPAQESPVIAADLKGKLEVEPMLQQQPDGSVTLPAYLGTLHGTKARLDSRGVIERWTDGGEWMEWDFLVSRPGEFEVELVTSEQKYGQGWEGGHRVSAVVAGAQVAGVVNNDGKLENPSNPYWPYVRSRIGVVRIGESGKQHLVLRADSIEAGKNWGLTLVSVVLRGK
jgi:alpha-L-fucosidase